MLDLVHAVKDNPTEYELIKVDKGFYLLDPSHFIICKCTIF